jgi:hypothetical protein
MGVRSSAAPLKGLMFVNPPIARTFLLFALSLAVVCPAARAEDKALDPGLVRRALTAELHNAPDGKFPMRYRLRKTSPRISTTKDIVETKEGAVARLVAVNDNPLSADDEQKELDRLAVLQQDPSRQKSRKQSQDEDLNHVLKMLRVLPDAFLYTYAGPGQGPTGKVEKFSFKPNPRFDPPDLETQLLTAMTGEIWIDPAQVRVTRLEGHLNRDVDFGWGILGRLFKGGWVTIEQADVGNRQWRIVRFQMAMNGRVLFRTKSFDTLEEESKFVQMPATIGSAQAVEMLRGEPARLEPGGH